MKKIKISVLMTVYNHDKYLKYSIKSIINQTYRNWELIIIDNGSTDNSKKEILKFKDKRIKKKFLKKNIGRTKCLNYGLDLCKGKYVAIQDSDDVSMRKRLMLQLKYLEKEKDVYLLGSQYIPINKKTNITTKVNKNIREILYKNFIPHSSVMYKRELINEVGKYPKNFYYAQDYAFYLKTLKKFKIQVIDKILVKIRYNHKNSEAKRLKNSKIILNERLRIMRWALLNLKTNNTEKIYILFEYIKITIKKFIL